MSRGQVVCFAPPHTSEQSWIILLNEVSGVKLVRQLRSKHRKRKDPFSWHLTRLEEGPLETRALFRIEIRPFYVKP